LDVDETCPASASGWSPSPLFLICLRSCSGMVPPPWRF
jgi:hypothetical protein